MSDKKDESAQGLKHQEYKQGRLDADDGAKCKRKQTPREILQYLRGQLSGGGCAERCLLGYSSVVGRRRVQKRPDDKQLG